MRIRSWMAAVVLLVGCADRRGGSPSWLEGLAEPARAAVSPMPQTVAPRAVTAARLEPPEPRDLVILAGGDVNLGRDVGQRILADATYDPFAEVRGWLGTADVVFANLESTLSEQAGQTRHPTERMVFTGPPDGADLLHQAGVSIVSVANNHAWDYGETGFLQTLEYLSRASVAYAGGRAAPDRQYEPLSMRVHDWSLAIIAVTDVWNPGALHEHPAVRYVARADLPRVVSAVRRARRGHDVVLVSYHGGQEYAARPSARPLAFAKAVMAAGADAILGHHPHVTQSIGWFDARPAFYSLGNLVFGVHREHPWTGRGYLVRLTFSRPHTLRVELCPHILTDDRPTPIAVLEPERWDPIFRSRWLEQAIGVQRATTAYGLLGEDGCINAAPEPEATPLNARERNGTLADLHR